MKLEARKDFLITKQHTKGVRDSLVFLKKAEVHAGCCPPYRPTGPAKPSGGAVVCLRELWNGVGQTGRYCFRSAASLRDSRSERSRRLALLACGSSAGLDSPSVGWGMPSTPPHPRECTSLLLLGNQAACPQFYWPGLGVILHIKWATGAVLAAWGIIFRLQIKHEVSTAGPERWCMDKDSHTGSWCSGRSLSKAPLP